MSIDLQGLSAKDLKNLIATAQDQLVKGERERIKSVREKIQQLLKEEGLTLEQVFSGAKLRAQGSRSVPPKYAHPDNPSLTWTGRGMKPKWFKQAVASGKQPEQLLVASAPPSSRTATKATRSKAPTKPTSGRSASKVAKKPLARKPRQTK